jgi:hypothetical protein
MLPDTCHGYTRMSHTDSVEHDSRGDGHAALYAFHRDQHEGLIGRWSLGEVGAKAAVPDPDFPIGGPTMVAADSEVLCASTLANRDRLSVPGRMVRFVAEQPWPPPWHSGFVEYLADAAGRAGRE